MLYGWRVRQECPKVLQGVDYKYVGEQNQEVSSNSLTNLDVTHAFAYQLR